MSWVAVGVTAGTAAMGIYQGSQQEEAEKRKGLAEAAKTRYAHLYGGQQGQTVAPSGTGALSGGMQGAATGLMLNQSAANSGGWSNMFGGGNEVIQPKKEQSVAMNYQKQNSTERYS